MVTAASGTSATGGSCPATGHLLAAGAAGGHLEVLEAVSRKYHPPQVFPLVKNSILTKMSAGFHGMCLVLGPVKMPAASTDVPHLLGVTLVW